MSQVASRPTEPGRSPLGRVHLIGIGGAGMSGIARLLLARGAQVSGSDARDSAVLAELRQAGAVIGIGHDAARVAEVDTVVVSTAVRATNPELAAARERGLPVLHRSEALAELMAGRQVAAVAGTHGKTTTTSMLVVALRAAGIDPSYAIGGDLQDGSPNAAEGDSKVFVAEADESDGSFLRYRPLIAVITNVEPDHLDHYGSQAAVEEAFIAFGRTVQPGGALVACADDPGAVRVARALQAELAASDVRVVWYGRSPDALVQVTDLRDGAAGVSCQLSPPGGPAVEVRLPVPGQHNALNAAAACAAAELLGAPLAAAAAGLAGFTGARRRFELRGSAGGVRVFDDYAHHPTEVAAVLQAARAAAGSGRIIAVFQPHLYSRTRAFAAEFGQALGAADEVVVLEVYAAREDPEPGVTGRLVADAVPLPAERVAFAPSGAAAAGEAARRARPGDVILTIGAGDVTELAPAILAAC